MLASTKLSQPIDRAAVVAALYAWTVTVALPLSHPLAPGTARGAAGAALAALLAATVLRRPRPALGRALGLWGFVGFSALAWGLGRALLLGYRLDPVMGVLGSIGWAAYGMTWAGSSDPPVRAADAGGQKDAPGDVRKPRTRPSPASLRFAVAGSSAAVVIVLSAWWIPDRARGVVGHAVALAGAAWVIVLSFDVAALWAAAPPADPQGQARRLRRGLFRARWPLAAAALIVVVGALTAWLR